MATSGSYDFGIDRDTLIKESLEILNAYDPVSTPSANEIFSCSRTLNMMLKSFQGQGLHLWKMEKVYLFMEDGKHEYTLGASGDNATLSFVNTAIRVAGSALDTTLEVDSTTGMTALDNIGVELTDGTMQWTTIASITDADTLVLTTALTGAAAIDGVVYSYTSKIQKPLRINNAFIHHASGGNEVELMKVSREEYYNLGIKTQEGTVNQIYFDPRRDDSTLRVYPQPNSTADYLVLICQYPFEDMDIGADEPDFPQEWYEAVVWNLAVRLMYKYGATVTQDRRREIMGIAKKMLEEALSFDTEDTSIFFRPDRRVQRL